MAKSYETEHPVKAFGLAATDSSAHLSPFKFSTRATGDEDVQFKVLYCGICHSDLNGESLSILSSPGGHEIVGVVTEVVKKVEKVKVGDKVGVGCMVGSCRSCESCKDDLENYCPKIIPTYRAPYSDGTITHGGYSDIMVADEHFIVRIPENMPLDSAAPLLCAGITHEILWTGQTSSSTQGSRQAYKAWCPRQASSSTHLSSPCRFKTLTYTDYIVSFMWNWNWIHIVAAGRKMISGSGIGGMKETQEMIDFAALN
ncbi:hypothetical protein SASPL_154657 [Salvia splendens]|uniref:Alcohol dehydrogenase-like N-terminal domain-containing protein n=1 Tax=Salvia splendens TaxID=180675 RepID=A0A8X8W0F9_SALSN|nr:hypothetical protein SASPL_154657 [Salvia splendens]